MGHLPPMQGDDMSIYTMKVLKGREVIAEFRGVPFDPQLRRIAELEGVIELEQRLERMYGLRFHIDYIPSQDPETEE
jgi:hypothetical protein